MEFLFYAIQFFSKLIDFLANKRKDKIKKEAEQKIDKAEKKIDNACDSGNIQDLFDAAEDMKNAKKLIKEIK